MNSAVWSSRTGQTKKTSMAQDYVDTQLSSSIKVLVLLLLSTGFQIDPVWNDQFSPTPLFAPSSLLRSLGLTPVSPLSFQPRITNPPRKHLSVTSLQHQSPPTLPKPTASPWPCHLTSRFFFPQLPSSFASSLCEPPNSYNHKTLLRSTSPLSCRSFTASHLISV